MIQGETLTNTAAPQAPLSVALRRAVYDEPDGPLPAMLLALTMLAGVVDATSILRLGDVFVATMTGNLVFIGLAAAGAKGFTVTGPLLSLGGFVIGALIGGRTCEAERSHRGRAMRNILAIKLSLACTVIVIAIIGGPRFSVGIRDAMVVLLATSMGAQLALIRYLKVPDLLTVVLTMTITGVLTERKRGLHDAAMLRRGLSLIAFAIGALSGGLLILGVGVTAALLLGLALIVGVMVAAYRVSRTPTSWSAHRTT